MPAASFEYAVIRVVPCVARQEFLTAGVLLSCPARDFLQARIELDRPRLQAFAPDADTELIAEFLLLIPLIGAVGAEAGPIGRVPQRALFHWLAAPRSTIIQLSPMHSGLCDDPTATLEHLLNVLVRPPHGAATQRS
jgi:hypothetical protein